MSADSPYEGMRMMKVNKANVSDEREDDENNLQLNLKPKQPMMSQPDSKWCFNFSASSKRDLPSAQVSTGWDKQAPACK